MSRFSSDNSVVSGVAVARTVSERCLRTLRSRHFPTPKVGRAYEMAPLVLGTQALRISRTLAFCWPPFVVYTVVVYTVENMNIVEESFSRVQRGFIKCDGINTTNLSHFRDYPGPAAVKRAIRRQGRKGAKEKGANVFVLARCRFTEHARKCPVSQCIG